MTRLSLGAFYNPHLAEVILATADEIDHLALADAPHPSDRSWLLIRQNFTLLAHDYLGQLSEPLTFAELDRARTIVEQYQSPWAAEHLQRIYPTLDQNADRPDVSLDYVFPPLYTEDLLQDYVQNARVLRNHLSVPLAIEPIPTYLQVDHPQLSEAAFLHRLCEESGCLLLLDIPHAMISAHTYGRDPASFILELPLHRVIELHVAGLAFNTDLRRPWIAPVVPDKEILNLAELAAEHTPQLRAITFDAFSPSLQADTFLEGMHLLRERFA
ncbi:multinuclear nonheme iron-dependent oxidase [Nitrospira sp. Nam74]